MSAILEGHTKMFVSTNINMFDFFHHAVHAEPPLVYLFVFCAFTGYTSSRSCPLIYMWRNFGKQMKFRQAQGSPSTRQSKTTPCQGGPKQLQKLPHKVFTYTLCNAKSARRNATEPANRCLHLPWRKPYTGALGRCLLHVFYMLFNAWA